MSSRRTSSEQTVSLFPFLAVLVCAMGALILLLLAMTQKIRVQQMARELAARTREIAQAPKPVPRVIVPRPAPPSVNEDFETERKRRREAWRQALAEAREKRDRERDVLHQRQRALAAAEQRLTEARSGVRQIRDRLQTVAAEKLGLDRAAKDLHDERVQVIEQLSLTQRDVSELKTRLANASSKFELVPYDGASGTTRRPIFIECTGKGFRILPEDEFMTFDSFNGFNERFNPLLNGTKALINYWNGKLKPGDDSEPKPYLLFLVRPSGTLPFYVARQLLERVNTPFGYELIEEDWPLHMPKPDAMARAILHEAITESIAHRDKMVKELAAVDGKTSGTGGGKSPVRIVPDLDDKAEEGGGGSGGNRGSGIDWLPDDGADGRHEKGPRRLAGGYGPESGNGGGGATGGSGTTGRFGGANGPNESGAMGSLGGNSVVARRGSAAAEGGTGTGGMEADVGTGTSSGTDPAGRGKSAKRYLATGRGAGAASGLPASIGATDGEPELDDGSQAADGPSGSGDGPGTEGPKLSSTSARGGAGRGGTGSGKPHSGKSGSRQTESGTDNGVAGQEPKWSPAGQAEHDRDAARVEDELASSGDEGEHAGRRPGSRKPGRSSKSIDRSAAPGTRQASGGLEPSLEDLPDEDEEWRGDQPPGVEHASRYGGQPPASSQGATGGSQSGSGTSRTKPASSQGKAGSPGGNGANQPSIGNQMGSGFQLGRSGGQEDPAGERSTKRWGYMNGRATIGLEKTLEIHLYANKILVGPRDSAFRVGDGETSAELVQRTLEKIERSTESWGRPPANFYWIPAIRFVVYPGGNQHYERLQGPLREAGLFSTVDFALGAPPKASLTKEAQ